MSENLKTTVVFPVVRLTENGGKPNGGIPACIFPA
jgi:hypothetical protein